MQVYFHPASTTSRSVMLYAAEEAPEIKFKVVDLFTGEHLKPEYASINPNCLMPLLEDGDVLLTESSAILKYLADKKGSRSYPKDLRERARVHERMDWFNSNIYRDFGYGLVYPQTFPNHRRRSDEAQAATLAWGRDKAENWLRTLDQYLIGPKLPYLCGEQLTIADYFGAEMIDVGTLIGCSYAAYPNIERWMANMRKLASWNKVHEVFYGFVGSLKDKSFVAIGAGA